ncbi:MAG: VCBS repeat-containing protein [Zetaproteobacteria bacterium]|nr:VCBS repeat-containing protein [Zetaproteobacteria bacterium]PJA07120.1 MAG: RNA-binding protein [Flavobacteriales bacterium CG_4_10_14_0_2_um_filter_35_18]
MKLNFLFLLMAISFFNCSNPKSDLSENKNNSHNQVSNFEQINPKQSGLHFSNTLAHNLKNGLNVFDYDYYYNGAGVGIADINNDGLKDIFFCANQGSNKLFLNKGNLVFEDITESANINTKKGWSSGVTFVDINNDGWLDIYVSQGGPYSKSDRANLLLINQKNNTFKEGASNYGLDDTGISTQSAFFDYDKDGDLDCVVMNENEYWGVDPLTFLKILSDKQKLFDNSSHLYQNDKGKFKNVTEHAGLLKPSFGLGLCVSDINNDNWLDIYIANDYYLPDVMYINNKNGTFTDQIKNTTNQISFSAMGVDIADINNDNLKDIFVLDMAPTDHIRSKTLMASMNVPQFEMLVKTFGFQAQYMFNSLQLNMGANKFHNIAQLAGLSKSDWSWAGLIFDTDNDGNEDLYITNGFRKYSSDNDVRMRITEAKKKYNGNIPFEIKETIYNNLPSEKLENILYKNNGDLNFKNVTPSSGLNIPSFSNGAAYADLDNDGDLDIVVNNIDDEAFLFKNKTIENSAGNFIKIITKGMNSENFAKVSISYKGLTKTKESLRVRGYLSTVDNEILFGLGKESIIDTVSVIWPSGKFEKRYKVKTNTTLTFNENDAHNSKEMKPIKADFLFTKVANSIDFIHKENDFNDFEKEILLPYKQSTLGPSINKGDVNNDGKDDFYIGGALGQAGQLFIQASKGFLKVKNQAFTDDARYEDMESLFVDIDNDGDNDLYVVSGGSEFTERSESLTDRLYLNDGKGGFSRTKSSDLKDYTISGKSVTKIDFDKDGDNDIIVGNRIKPQKYPLSDPSLIYENVNGTLRNVTAMIAPDFENFGIVNKVITTDFNNDGWDDFIAVGEWTPIGIFLNEKGTFRAISKESNLDNEKGWWYSIIETDVNKDGNKDYIIGNVGLNYKYHVDSEKPLRIYAGDFDLNGTQDDVLSYKFKGNFVPARGKECSTQQMPFISKKTPSYKQFANATLVDIYGEKINNAYQREVNEFHSILLLNEGNGKFKKLELPIMAQSLPILDGDVFDFNKDGFEDLIIVGNIFNTEVETPRLDNPFALILISNKKDGYTVLGPDKTGLFIDGNAKSVKIIKQNYLNKIFAVIATNNAKTEVFELSH